MNADQILGWRNNDVEKAELRICDAENALGRVLTKGEKRDLLADNFTGWSLEYIRKMVDHIEEG